MAYVMSGLGATSSKSASDPATYLKQIGQLSGNKAELERLLKSLIAEANACRTAATQAKKNGKLSVYKSTIACCKKLDTCIAACKQAIAQCSKRMRTQVMPSPSGSVKEVVVESSTAVALPGGAVAPGPDAVIDTSPSVSPSIADEGQIKPQDVTVGVSTGTVVTVLGLGAAAFMGWRWLKKRGHA